VTYLLRSDQGVPSEAWFSAPVELHFQVFDASLDGLQTTYLLDGGDERDYTKPFVIDKEGTTAVTFWSVDGSVDHNAEAPKTEVVRVDSSAPSVVVFRSGLGDPDPSLLLRATDRLSGLFALEWRLDDGPSSSKTFGAESTDLKSWAARLSQLPPGQHRLSYWVSDRVEHERSGEITFTVKPVQKLSISPASRTLVRTGGVASARFGFAAADSSGTPLARKTVYLEKSTNGTTWKRVQTVKAGASGRGTSAPIRFTMRGTTYWRWYSPEGSKTRSAYSAKAKIIVR
jgi:hypothetical protein